MRHGHSVENLDASRGAGAAADLKVKRHGRAINIEVYAPRYWEGLEDFVDELRLCLMHLDVPYDYCFSVKIGLSRKSTASCVLQFDPWDFSEAMKELSVRQSWLNSYLPRIRSSLLGASPTEEVQGEVRGKRTTSLVQLSFSEVSRSHQTIPDRFSSWVFSKSGYDPVKAFDQMLRLHVCKGKLPQRQFLSCDPKVAGALVIDLNRFDVLTTEERDSRYRQELVKVLMETVCPLMPSIPVDAVLFIRANNFISFPFICFRESAAELVEDVLVGSNRNLEDLGESW